MDKKIVDMNEIRRLQKAARDKNINHLVDWFTQFDEQLRGEYNRAFEAELGDAIDNFILTIVYTLHFNECTKFGNKRINDFMEDLFETIDMFRRGEAVPDDYKKHLESEGIKIIRSDK